MTPQFIDEHVRPNLQKQVNNSNGRYIGYFLYPCFSEEGLKKMYTNPHTGECCTRPRRLLETEKRFGDFPIYYGTVEVGWLIASTNWLSKEATMGPGIPLF
jgi:hypothetical protein